MQGRGLSLNRKTYRIREADFWSWLLIGRELSVNQKLALFNKTDDTAHFLTCFYWGKSHRMGARRAFNSWLMSWYAWHDWLCCKIDNRPLGVPCDGQAYPQWMTFAWDMWQYWSPRSKTASTSGNVAYSQRERVHVREFLSHREAVGVIRHHCVSAHEPGFDDISSLVGCCKFDFQDLQNNFRFPKL